MFAVGGVSPYEYELDIFQLGAVEVSGTVDLISLAISTPVVGTVGLLDIVFEGLAGTFPVVPIDATVIVGIRPILMTGGVPSAGAGINVTVGLLDTLFIPLRLYGPTEEYIKGIIATRYWTLTVKGLPDVVVPMSSFSENSLAGVNIQYRINIPDGPTYSELLIASIDSKFYITAIEVYQDGSVAERKYKDISIGSVKVTDGDRPYIVLTGLSVYGYTEPKKIKLAAVFNVSITTSGIRTVLAFNDMDLLSGDTAILPNGELVRVGAISRMINNTSQRMILTEQ